VITIGRAEIALAAKEALQGLCDLYGIGIEVQQLVLQDVNPPAPVRPAFNEVNQAIQEKERAINEAWAEYNQAVPRAKGEAEQAVRAAEGYALDRENRAAGDADRFESLHEEYRKAPDVTRRRMYLETMAEIVPQLGRKVIVDETARSVLPLLQLDGPAAPAVKEVKP
jgi:membrane protease subunit HflK